MAGIIFQKIAKVSPFLKAKLRQAGMDIKPEDFVKNTALSAFYMTTGFFVFLLMILSKFNAIKNIFFIIPPILFFIIFSYMMRLPDIKISRREKEISKEIVFAGRFLVIEIESGVPLYNALSNLSKNYEIVGAYVREIINKVDLGTSLEDAVNE